MNIKSVVHKVLDNYQSIQYENIINTVSDYECVSFDIFDTLVKRDVPNPVDVFTIVGNKFNIKNFKEIRIAAEKTARTRSNNEEITIDDIYNELVGISESDREKIKEYELKTEIDIATPNMDITRLYQYCIQNKRVILISDMYLSRETVIAILNKCSINGYQKLYISNEFNKTKASGSLYDYVVKDIAIDCKNAVHIGNSFRADYLKAKTRGIKSIKVATYIQRTAKRYGNILCDGRQEKKDLLDSYLNNHTPGKKEVSQYYKFGFERFGPLLYGFITWLNQDMVKEGVEQVLFLARDGYVMRKAYTILGFREQIQDYYFEASRRSLRVPTYKKTMRYEDVLQELTVPNKTNISQIFDSLGLKASEYKSLIEEKGFSFDEQIKRDTLVYNNSMRELFESIKEDMMNNAETEKEFLRGYIKQYDFSKKTAIVDIGWGGSMQKYLTQTLNSMGISHNIIGYYVGLTEKSIQNLGANGLKAKGYAFDRLNGSTDVDLERPFVGLFETLFLEQRGSVIKYKKEENEYIALRYPYEYLDSEGSPTIEAVNVSEIQDGALCFVSIYKNSLVADQVGTDSNVLFSNLYETGTSPTMDDVRLFGFFNFFNNGSKVYLANPKSIFYYSLHLNELKKDLFDSQWKVGFLKGLLKIPLPYLKLFGLLRKASN